MFRRFVPLLALAWMLVLGGVLRVGIGDPGILGDPNATPVCLVCGGRSGYFRDVGDLVIGLLTVGLVLAGLIVSLPRRRGAGRGCGGQIVKHGEIACRHRGIAVGWHEPRRVNAEVSQLWRLSVVPPWGITCTRTAPSQPG